MEKPKKDAGGSEEFRVVQNEKEKIEEEERALGEEHPSEEVSATTLAVNEALIETCCLVVGKVVALAAKMPELAFDEAETQQLKDLWSPLIPGMPPVALAVLGTMVIVGGKVGVYFSLRKKKEGKKSAAEIAKEEEEKERLRKEKEEEEAKKKLETG